MRLKNERIFNVAVFPYPGTKVWKLMHILTGTTQNGKGARW
jgi:hypothetical protein